MNFIEYSFNWGKSLGEGQYATMNFMLLVFGLIGAVSCLVLFGKLMNKWLYVKEDTGVKNGN